MKRVLIAVLVLLIAHAAFAFDATRHAERIGILRSSEPRDDAMTPAITDAVVRSLTAELRHRGFEVFPIAATVDEISRMDVPDADYLIEIRGEESSSEDYGGVGIGGRDVGVELSVLVSHVAAELRVYDAETLRLLVTQPLKSHTTALVPSGVAIGGDHFFGYIALPFFRWAQYRTAVRGAARSAAAVVTTAVRGE